jgi:hypothetical protein
MMTKLLRIKEDDHSFAPPKTASIVWVLLIVGMATSGVIGYGIALHQWAYLHAKEIQLITEHIINAKAELEAGNRQACSDELTRMTSDFQKLY